MTSIAEKVTSFGFKRSVGIVTRTNGATPPPGDVPEITEESGRQPYDTGSPNISWDGATLWPLPGLAPMTRVRTEFGDVPAFALRKGDFDTLVFFNSWIQTKRDTGWLQEKHHYWFGTRDWAHLVGAQSR